MERLLILLSQNLGAKVHEVLCPECGYRVFSLQEIRRFCFVFRQHSRLKTEGLTGLDICDPISHHPGRLARKRGVATEDVLEKTGAGFPASTLVFSAMITDMRAQDKAAGGLGELEDLGMYIFQIFPSGLPFGGGRLIAHHHQAIAGACQTGESFGNVGEKVHLGGVKRAVDGTLFRIYYQCI
jgi:hypothetical protein